MPKFGIKDDKIVYGSKVLGPVTALYVDADSSSRELRGKGVVTGRQNPERIDFVFAAGEKVVVGESKTVDDLVSSWMGGRLQRQFRVMLETTQDVGYAFLLIRGSSNWHDIDGEAEVRNDLLKWQMLGGLIVFGPEGSPLSVLGDVKAILSGQRNVRTAIARYEKREYGGTEQEQVLQRMFRGKGLGPKTAKALMAKYGSVMKALEGEDKEWKECGATRKLVAARGLVR